MELFVHTLVSGFFHLAYVFEIHSCVHQWLVAIPLHGYAAACLSVLMTDIDCFQFGAIMHLSLIFLSLMCCQG